METGRYGLCWGTRIGATAYGFGCRATGVPDDGWGVSQAGVMMVCGEYMRRLGHGGSTYARVGGCTRSALRVA